MEIDRSGWNLIARSFACVALVGSLGSGCANQTPVIPMLTVQPNAGARIFYFERRAHAMFGKREAEGQPEGEGTEEAGEGNGEGEGKAADAEQRTPCAPRAWGVEPAERTSCDPR